jgi:cell division protein FtsB
MTDKQIIIYKKECYNEPYCSLNQVLEQLEAYKMEAEEGKEINAELKAENKKLLQRETPFIW